ncbi:hypothetical protein [Kumtagia ephedrae]|uniref:hypothetical protein n=1 Tax=Kumtagia ephedrae TaxID=2116701 RepID=UPI00140248CD|nr:hypothetical protein [Mesorhizobium ephedrae]
MKAAGSSLRFHGLVLQCNPSGGGWFHGRQSSRDAYPHQVGHDDMEPIEPIFVAKG